MKRVDFTEGFYKALYDEIMKAADDLVYDGDKGYPDTFYAGGYQVDLTVYYGWELHDDSFDHAFGTWHDPNPYMQVTNLEDIDGVRIWDEDTDEEVSGFSTDAFMAQFDDPEPRVPFIVRRDGHALYVYLKKGDRVLYKGREATFAARNTENGTYRIDDGGGSFYVDGASITPIQ